MKLAFYVCFSVREEGLRDLINRIGKSKTDNTHNLIIDLNCHVSNQQNVTLSVTSKSFSIKG
jgi:hypothetical protein